jgi:hypothetical protein
LSAKGTLFIEEYTDAHVTYVELEDYCFMVEPHHALKRERIFFAADTYDEQQEWLAAIRYVYRQI